MKAEIVAVAVVLAALFWGELSWAGWQYTEWGMSPEEVAEASEANSESRDVHRAGDYRFRVEFSYESNERERVTLQLEEKARCPELAGDMRVKYGKPTEESRSRIGRSWVWRDQDANNHIVLNRLGSELVGIRECRLSYRNIDSQESEGL